MHIRFENKFEKSESWCPDIFLITKIVIFILIQKKKTKNKKTNEQPHTKEQTKPKNLPLEMKLIVRLIL